MIRKYIYKLRYILIILSALLGLMGLSSSFGYNLVSCGTEWFGETYCGELNPGEITTTLGSNYNSIGEYFQFRNEDNLLSFDFKRNGGESWNNTFWSGDDLYTFAGQGIYGELARFKNLCLINSVDYSKVYPVCFDDFAFNLSISNFVSAYKGKQVQKYLITNGNGEYSNAFEPYICAVYDNSIVCFYTFSQNDQGRWRENVDIVLTGLNVGYDFAQDNLNYSNSPLRVAGGGGSSSSSGNGVFDSNIGITNLIILDDYEKRGFTKEICYGGAFSGNQLITAPGTGLDIFSLFNDGDHNPLGFNNIIDWYSYYRDSIMEYRNISSGSAFFYSGAFHYAHWNLFANMLRYGVSIYPPADIIDYCDIVIKAENDPSILGDIYEGDIEEWERQAIYNNYTIINYYGLSGFDFSGSFSTLTGYSGSDIDLSAFDFFRELSVSFNNRLGQVNGNLFGIIPSYILVFMFALIFIRILRK